MMWSIVVPSIVTVVLNRPISQQAAVPGCIRVGHSIRLASHISSRKRCCLTVYKPNLVLLAQDLDQDSELFNGKKAPSRAVVRLLASGI
jgi:hypothetical protein